MAAAEEAAELYGLPLEEFTAARNELARRLRGEGKRDEAAEVAALRKPVLSAWVVNRLAREQRADVRKLLDAAAGIRAGRSGADEAFREATDRLTRAARALLEAGGRSAEGVVQEVATTLRAGAASDSEALEAGMLTQPLEPSGFLAMAGASPAPPRTGRAKKEPERRPRVDRRRVEEARKRLAEAREEARRLAREASAAERAAREAREAADGAARRVEEAEELLAAAREPS